MQLAERYFEEKTYWEKVCGLRVSKDNPVDLVSFLEYGICWSSEDHDDWHYYTSERKQILDAIPLLLSRGVRFEVNLDLPNMFTFEIAQNLDQIPGWVNPENIK